MENQKLKSKPQLVKYVKIGFGYVILSETFT